MGGVRKVRKESPADTRLDQARPRKVETRWLVRASLIRLAFFARGPPFTSTCSHSPVRYQNLHKDPGGTCDEAATSCDCLKIQELDHFDS